MHFLTFIILYRAYSDFCNALYPLYVPVCPSVSVHALDATVLVTETCQSISRMYFGTGMAETGFYKFYSFLLMFHLL